MATSFKRLVVSSIRLTIDGADTNARIFKCNYSFTPADENALSNGNRAGIISLEAVLDKKSKTVPDWIVNDSKKINGVVAFLGDKGEAVREITFIDAVTIAFAESVDVAVPKELISQITLSAEHVELK